MTGNKANKNQSKKSWIKHNIVPCCFYCEGNWYKYLIARTRTRNKYIKHRNAVEWKNV